MGYKAACYAIPETYVYNMTAYLSKTYMYNMTVYLNKGKKYATAKMTVTHAAVVLL
jgi:hypothetical protein